MGCNAVTFGNVWGQQQNDAENACEAAGRSLGRRAAASGSGHSLPARACCAHLPAPTPCSSETSLLLPKKEVQSSRGDETSAAVREALGELLAAQP